MTPTDVDRAAIPAIKAVGLSRFYGERAALDNVSFEVRAGETLSVFGANGAGKSTLLRILSTLLRPHDGEISVLGHELPRASWAVRGKVGFIGHDPMLYRDLTARENLNFIARIHGESTEHVDEMLERIELDKRADEPVRNFSKGMLQRLSTARALLPQPELLLLDEPRANLDPGASLLLDPFIGAAAHRTRVIVTHDVDYGLEQADMALGLKRGKVEWFEPSGNITSDQARRLYK